MRTTLQRAVFAAALLAVGIGIGFACKKEGSGGSAQVKDELNAAIEWIDPVANAQQASSYGWLCESVAIDPFEQATKGTTAAQLQSKIMKQCIPGTLAMVPATMQRNDSFSPTIEVLVCCNTRN